MRLLYVTDSVAIWGGLERILVEKMNYLAEEYGYEVFLSTLSQGSHVFPYQLSSKVCHHDLNVNFFRQYEFKFIKRFFFRCKYLRQYKKKLREQIELLKPDIIIYVRLYLVKILLDVKGDIPLLIESHSGCSSYKYYVDSCLQRLKEERYIRLSQKAQMIVALTEGDACEWRTINKNVSVIPNFVHLNTTGGYSDCQAKSAIFVGRFSRQKDMRSLLDIWKKVQYVHNDWNLHIFAGFGEQYDQLRPIVEQPELNVFLHSPTPYIIDEYIKNSILLMTSLTEPFGLVLPEAMSCGLPVVAFDCPYGPADIISDGVDGFLVRDRNISEFVEKVCILIDDITLRQKMGAAGILSSKRYAPKIIMPKWKSLFEQIKAERINSN